ncbi:MAG: transcriptional regulator [Sphingomonas bacterium]|uniref:helix-turn-helix transcriptional regulator n=1 Tax=Sphingomonas bacterium TaxID=1895847 RepID=UPI00260F9C8F|nr:AlpA family phage regulatory protein [Sphingomonas bacterium]MDB5706605.1 transcriptional regulator [Sphingomonas bacterium]
MDRLISKIEVRSLVVYSNAHIARLEAEGLFPKRVRLSVGRVAWLESEIRDWIADKVAARDATRS